MPRLARAFSSLGKTERRAFSKVRQHLRGKWRGFDNRFLAPPQSIDKYLRRDETSEFEAATLGQHTVHDIAFDLAGELVSDLGSEHPLRIRIA